MLGVPHKLSRTEAAVARRGGGNHRTGWAYANKSTVWHEIDRYGQTSCGRAFNSYRATWCRPDRLPNEVERCRRCEAHRLNAEAAAAEQARIKYETRHQLSLNF